MVGVIKNRYFSDLCNHSRF